MSDPKQPTSERNSAKAIPESKKSQSRDRAKSDPAPDDSIEGEGSPGLTITGGGGHA